MRVGFGGGHAMRQVGYLSTGSSKFRVRPLGVSAGLAVSSGSSPVSSGSSPWWIIRPSCCSHRSASMSEVAMLGDASEHRMSNGFARVLQVAGNACRGPVLSVCGDLRRFATARARSRFRRSSGVRGACFGFLDAFGFEVSRVGGRAAFINADGEVTRESPMVIGPTRFRFSLPRYGIDPPG